MKYICGSREAENANIEAFIDERGEISFETVREIGKTQELLFTFGNKYRANEPGGLTQGNCSNTFNNTISFR